jgi:hypothetical protein
MESLLDLWKKTNDGKMKSTRKGVELPELLTKLTLIYKEKKNQKRKVFEPTITRRVISCLKTSNQLFFYLLFLLGGSLS